MSEVFSFTASNRAALIDELGARDVPLRLRIVPHGAARGLSREVVLRVCSGRLIAVASPTDLPISRALLRVALAESGRIEVSPDEAAPATLGSFPAVRRLYGEAETAARALSSVLAPIGGLGSLVVTRSEAVVRAAPYLSRPALELARVLIDVPRRVSEVLNSVAQDDLHTARLLDQLRDTGVLEVTAASERRENAAGPRQSARGMSAVRSSRSGRRPGVPPGRSSLRPGSIPPPRPSDVAPPPGQEPLEVPELVDEDEALEPAASLSPEAWAKVRPQSHAERARAAEAPTVEVPPPVVPPAEPRVRIEDRVEPRRPVPSPEAAADPDDDRDAMRAAGVGGAGFGLWLLIGAAVIGGLAAIWLATRKTPEPPELPPVLAPIVEVPARTTTTATLAQPKPPASSGEKYSLSRPPPIAGPEADRRLREAEALIDAGDYDGAEEILAPLRKSSAGDATVWVLSAHLEAERGRFPQALGYVDRGLAIAPKHYRAHVLKGSIFQFQGRLQNAIASYKRALSLDPRHVMSPELRLVTEGLERDPG